MRIVLGVAGGIAAYKACGLLRLLSEAEHDVQVVPTAAALRFVGAPTWEALSGRPVHTEVWDDITQVPHVRIGQEADLIIVAPATADLLARAAHGLADDLLTNVLLTARCPILLAPAMHTEMWLHPATQDNVDTLRRRGVHVLEPASGRLTGADSGPGRLPEPVQIRDAALLLVARPGGHGLRAVITAGGTREPLDPVRFLGNRSSGKQGIALAQAAVADGADVTLIVGSIEVPLPAAGPSEGLRVVTVDDAQSMREAVHAAAAQADVVIMAAAVADYRPAQVAATKLKKSNTPGEAACERTIELVRNPDILAELVTARGQSTRPYLVGFAAETGDETGDVLELGRAKLARKGCDLLAVNEVGIDKTFGHDENTLRVLTAGQPDPLVIGPDSKTRVAAALWRLVTERMRG